MYLARKITSWHEGGKLFMYLWCVGIIGGVQLLLHCWWLLTVASIQLGAKIYFFFCAMPPQSGINSFVLVYDVDFSSAAQECYIYRALYYTPNISHPKLYQICNRLAIFIQNFTDIYTEIYMYKCMYINTYIPYTTCLCTFIFFYILKYSHTYRLLYITHIKYIDVALATVDSPLTIWLLTAGCRLPVAGCLLWSIDKYFMCFATLSAVLTLSLALLYFLYFYCDLLFIFGLRLAVEMPSADVINTVYWKVNGTN